MTAPTKKDVLAALKKGGEHYQMHSVVAEVYDVEGIDRKRATGAGQTTFVRPILNPDMRLTPRQRAVGNTYGGYVEELMSGGRKEALTEYVDKTSGTPSSPAEYRLHLARMITSARNALIAEKPIRFRKSKPRSNCWIGPHRMIRPERLIHHVCCEGRAISWVAFKYEWTRRRRIDGKLQHPHIPDREKKLLTQKFRDMLDVIDDAWNSDGFSVPYGNSKINVE